MADVPVPGSELSGPEAGALEARIGGSIPDAVHGLLQALWNAGHAAYVVGGSLRDTILGRDAKDWDLATDALPEETLAVFPDAAYENAFGTVAVRRVQAEFEITTFRSEHDYADFRRPHRVEFGTSLDLDLARRDFTMNALAWGAEAGAAPARLCPAIRAGLFVRVGTDNAAGPDFPAASVCGP